MTWNAAADLSDGAHALSVGATLTYEHVALKDADYVIVDLSSGVGGSYPVRAVRAPGLATAAFNQMVYKTEKIVFKRVPKGGFWMGAPESDKDKNVNNARPSHYVELRDDFFLGVFETTIGQYERSVGKWTGNSHKSDERDWAPVRSNYNTAQAVLESLRNGSGFSSFAMPTEAQWEYACRAGTTTKYHWGDLDSDSGPYAWTLENSGKVDRGVGQRLPNPWGFYDITGNVYEDCADFYASAYSDTGTEESPTYDPTGPEQPATSPQIVVRGGSGGNGIGSCRSYFRGNANYPKGAYNNDGFRAAISPVDATEESSGREDYPAAEAVSATVDVSSSAVCVVSSVAALCPLAWSSSADWTLGGDEGATADLVLETMAGDPDGDPSAWSAGDAVTLVGADVGEGTVDWPTVGKRLYRVTLSVGGTSVGTAYFNLQGATGTGAGKDIAACDIRLETSGYYATGYPLTPRLTIYDGADELVQGRDYAVSLSDAVRIGTTKVSIVGLGAYDGYVADEIVISPYEPETAAEDVAAAVGADFRDGAALPFVTTNDFFAVAWTTAADWSADGGAQGATVTVCKMLGDPEAEPSTWTASAEGETTVVTASSGEGTVRWLPTAPELYRLALTVGGASAGVAYLDFTGDEELFSGTLISTCDISVSVEPLPSTGYPRLPEITIRNGGTELVEGVDYDVAALDNVNPGTASLTIIGKGDYSGRYKTSFTVGPSPAPQEIASGEKGGAFADARTNALAFVTWRDMPPLTYNDVSPVAGLVPWPAGGCGVAGAEARILVAPIVVLPDVGLTNGEYTVKKTGLTGEGAVRLRLPAGPCRLRLETGVNGVWSADALTADVDFLNQPGTAILLR